MDRTKKFYYIVFFLLSFVFFLKPVFGESYISRGKAAEIIWEASCDYHKTENKYSILKGYSNGMLLESNPATKLETYCFLSRAFGPFPAPQGDSQRKSVLSSFHNDTLSWAEQDLNELSQAGILLLEERNTEELSRPITQAELKRMLSRVYAYLGSNIKDDFYSTINKTYLDTAEISPGYSKDSIFIQLKLQNQKNLETILDTLTEKSFPHGSKEQKMISFYQSALDVDSQNAMGLKPIEKYLSLFQNAQNFTELLDAEAQLISETGQGIFFQFYISADSKNSQKNSLYFAGPSLWPGKNTVIENKPETMDIYENTIARLLVLQDPSLFSPLSEAKKILSIKSQLASSSLDTEAYSDVEQVYNPLSLEEFCTLFSEGNPGVLLEKIGLNKAEQIIVTDIGLTNKLSQLMSEIPLDIWKKYACIELLWDYRSCLGEELLSIANEFDKKRLGTIEPIGQKKRAVSLTSNYLNDYLGQIYVKQYFSKESKEEVEAMVSEFIQIYQQRLQNVNWMSDKTKQEAIQKLQNLQVKIGYPESEKSIADAAEIKSFEEGGSLCNNILELQKQDWNASLQKLSQPVDKMEWLMNVYEVNAYYYPNNNEIVFPAGILQEPIYSPLAAKEQNYGAIGTIIAHEISHAFDQSGAKYDEKGNAKNWWTEEDYQKFEEKCSSVVQYYDKIEIIPGINSNGKLTLGENIADLGGVACALEAVKQLPNPDYSLFFQSYANLWKGTGTKEVVSYLNQTDVHSAGKIRVNQTVSAFPEFYEAFHITETDGMYIAPEKRVSVW